MSHYESDCYRGDCTGRVCMNEAQYDDAKTRGTRFYCSAGHGQVFTETEISKLRKRVAELERSIDERAKAKSERVIAQQREFAESMVEYYREQSAAFRSCPFALYDACPQGHYEYASPEQLVRHLANRHGVKGLWADLRVVRSA